MGLVGGVAGGAHPWFAAKREHLQSGIIGQDYFSGSVAAVELGFPDGISRESCAIFFHRWQRLESRQRCDHHMVKFRCSGEIAQFTRIRSRDEYWFQNGWKWCARQDSNLQPPASYAGALPS